MKTLQTLKLNYNILKILIEQQYKQYNSTYKPNLQQMQSDKFKEAYVPEKLFFVESKLPHNNI